MLLRIALLAKKKKKSLVHLTIKKQILTIRVEIIHFVHACAIDLVMKMAKEGRVT